MLRLVRHAPSPASLDRLDSWI
uniref:Uncharacterized protein n=1 Tax=Rhizophora mucronata TaxID=61149 RepID=A0A2P2QR27_RHIMU